MCVCGRGGGGGAAPRGEETESVSGGVFGSQKNERQKRSALGWSGLQGEEGLGAHAEGRFRVAYPPPSQHDADNGAQSHEPGGRWSISGP